MLTIGHWLSILQSVIVPTELTRLKYKGNVFKGDIIEDVFEKDMEGLF